MGEDQRLESCKVKHTYIEKILFGLIAVFCSVLVYAMDWQREQDEQMAGFRSLIAEQRTLLKLQQDFQRHQIGAPPVTSFSLPPHLGTIGENNPAESWSIIAPAAASPEIDL